MKPFGENFLWGAATAAAQIEGGCSEGGRTPSIWDVAPAEKIKNGENCHIAADHFHRMREDVALMKKLGLKSYRFSVSWPRVVPAPGKINAEGLKFYSDLVDELLAAGITPLVTLYHWDMPVWADALCGWESKAIIGHFLEYAAAVVDALSDRVKYWITFNEPSCFLMNGYMQGVHAPFKRHYLALPKFTLIGATTKAGMLTSPLRDRFGVNCRLEMYTPEQLAKIVRRSAAILGVEITDDGAVEIARRSRGTPRIANRILKRVRDFAEVKGEGVIDYEVADHALGKMEIDKLGLDSVDAKIILTMIDKFGGGPVGLDTLAASIGEDSGTIEDVYEPYLMQIAFIARTPRGRVVLPDAYKHFGRDVPQAAIRQMSMLDVFDKKD